MTTWSEIFNELDDTLKQAKRKFKYSNATKLQLRVIFVNGKGMLYKGTLSTIKSILWKVTEEYGLGINKFAISSIHGRRIFYKEVQPDLSKLITGDEVTIENFEHLSEEARAIRIKVLNCQILDRLVQGDQISRRNK
ncbi:MAG TPA: hypothetical protein VMW10_03725 [Alphaproteobacteria bacterium]|nr:hypothetical protein [Alphaproteobacteria bacterium]